MKYKKSILTKAVISTTALALLSFVKVSQQNNMFLNDNLKPKKESDYQHKVKDDKIYVHLLPHSHDDIGWLKSVDMYFSGTNETIARGSVMNILDTTVHELLKDPAKKFCYCEVKYLQMWWKYQSDEMKTKVRGLVNNGQLELVNGGWSSHDEACTHYEDQLTNMQIGQQFLKQEFGVTPRVGFQIDPFGHSSANQRLYADMGLEAVFIARADLNDKARRVQDREMEWLWRPMFNHLGKQNQIFTHLMLDGYCPPNYFGYDIRDDTDNDTAFIDNIDFETFNADWKTKEFMDLVDRYSKIYRTNHILVPFGCDFHFGNAKQNYRSIDKMIKYINDRNPNVQLMYSTPSEYLDEVYKAGIEWPTRYDDMFPYASGTDDFWTGYFSSRQISKRFIRDGQQNLISSNKQYAYVMIDQSSSDQDITLALQASNSMQDAIGVYQHHDAVTGTSKQFVADDYVQRLNKAMIQNKQVYSKFIKSQALKDFGVLAQEDWAMCSVTNATYLECPVANYSEKPFLMIVHNPSNSEIYYQKIKMPTDTYNASVWDNTKKQFVDIRSTCFCHKFTYYQSGQQTYDCNFIIENTILANSYSLVKIQYNPDPTQGPSQLDPDYKEKISQFASKIEQSEGGLNVKPIHLSLDDMQRGLGKIGYFGDDDNGSKFRVQNSDGVDYYFYLQFRYYNSDNGSDTHKASGHYFFQPQIDQQESLKYNVMEGMEALWSNFSQELYMTYYNYTSENRRMQLRVRAYEKLPTVEFELYMEPIPKKQGSQEVTVTLQPSPRDNAFANDNIFYTDSNGLEMQRREWNKRPTYIYTTNSTTSSNYYPVASAVTVLDTNSGSHMQFTVINDRAQGGSVKSDTSRVELMINRRIFHLDGEIQEFLDEGDTPVRTQFWVQIFNRSNENSFQRQQQMINDEQPQYFFSSQWTFQEEVELHTNYQGMSELKLIDKLDADRVHAIKYTLTPLKRHTILVRFQNLDDLFDYEKSATLNDTVVYIDVDAFAKELYDQVNPQLQAASVAINEVTLTGTQDYEEMQAKKPRLTGVDDGTIVEPVIPKDKSKSVIALSAQMIRTFEIIYDPKKTILQ